MHKEGKGKQIAATGLPKPKVQNKKKVLLRLWKYLYRHKWMLLLALFLTVTSNLLALLGPMPSSALQLTQSARRRAGYSLRRYFITAR